MIFKIAIKVSKIQVKIKLKNICTITRKVTNTTEYLVLPKKMGSQSSRVLI